MSEEKLAIAGGTPVRATPLPWEFPGAHWLGTEEQQNLMRVIAGKSPFRYYGPELQHMVDHFETESCRYWQRRFAVAVNSGTAALAIALAALGVGPGDEVLLPGYMWVSCVSAVVRLGAIPKLVDIDNTFCMDPHDLERKISPQSKVILFVHMNGACGHIEQVSLIAKKHKLFLLEDCAQAAGAASNGTLAGCFGDIATFSLQLNKNFTSGEGGLILCDDEHLYRRSFAIHDLGYARNDAGRLDVTNPNYQLWGMGSRMSELTGACALAQLQKLNSIISSMHHAKWSIRQSLQHIPQLQFRNIPDPSGDSSPFLITIYPNEETCLKFTEALMAEGIQGPEGSLSCALMRNWGLHWYFNIPNLIQKTSWCADGFPWSHPANQFAQHYDYAKGTLPHCDDLAARSALLSIASCLTAQDIHDITTAFKKVARALFG